MTPPTTALRSLKCDRKRLTEQLQMSACMLDAVNLTISDQLLRSTSMRAQSATRLPPGTQMLPLPTPGAQMVRCFGAWLSPS
jgi:hypothetical protein